MRETPMHFYDNHFIIYAQYIYMYDMNDKVGDI